MLIYAALATLMCSSLIDARLERVDSDDTLALCKKQMECKNRAVEIDKSTEFHPTIKASGEVKLNLTVKSKQPLIFPVHPKNSDVKWTIKRPVDNCAWEIKTEDQSMVSFKELDGEGKLTKEPASCISNEVNVAFRKEGAGIAVDVSGESCDKKSQKLTCKYALPNSDLIADWDIWELFVSAEPTTSTASITLEDAYVVYDAPEPTTTTSNGTFNGTTENPNNATTTHNATNTTPDAALSATTWGLIGGCVLLTS